MGGFFTGAKDYRVISFTPRKGVLSFGDRIVLPRHQGATGLPLLMTKLQFVFQWSR